MRFLFWKALIGLFVYDMLLLNRNLAKMCRLVRDWRVSSRIGAADAVEQVSLAMNYACIWYPKHILCLQRSAVTTCLLRHVGLSAQMVMGARQIPFKAHAWTELHGRAINERTDVQSKYRVWDRC
jgi:hypothetical protein